MLLFAAITQRGGIISEDPPKYLRTLGRKYPDLLDPAGILHNWSGPKAVERALVEVVIAREWENNHQPVAHHQLALFPLTKQPKKEPYKVDEFASSWWHNALTVATRWDNNILNAFEGVVDFEEFFARVDYKRNQRGLHGMRRKVLSLFTIWLQEFGLIPNFPTPIPVDFHAMRLLFGTGVVRTYGFESFIPNPKNHPANFAGRRMLRVTEAVMDAIALWTLSFLPQNGFSHLVINPALWVLSRELCPHEFQNQSTLRKQRMRVNWSDKLREDPALWPVPYSDPAISCPVARWCTKTVAWGPYYDWGLLTLDDRVSYPHQRLHGWVPPDQHPGRRKNDRA